MGALGNLAFAADHLADALEIARHGVVELDDLVEGAGDLAIDTGEVQRQPH